MSIYLASVMAKLIKARPEWSMEFPLYTEDRKVIGYQLMTRENSHAYLSGDMMGEAKKVIPVPHLILKGVIKQKIPLLIAAGSKIFLIRGENVEIKNGFGEQTTRQGIVFSKIDIDACDAEEIKITSMTELPKNEF